MEEKKRPDKVMITLPTKDYEGLMSILKNNVDSLKEVDDPMFEMMAKDRAKHLNNLIKAIEKDKRELFNPATLMQ